MNDLMIKNMNKTLSIGDWVIKNGSYYHIKTAVDLMVVGKNPEYGWGYIGITEKLLEKVLRFQKTQTYGGSEFDYDIDDKYYIKVNYDSMDENKPFHVQIENERWSELGCCDVMYLHQLQQIVRLVTDKELEIKSPGKD